MPFTWKTKPFPSNVPSVFDNYLAVIPYQYPIEELSPDIYPYSLSERDHEFVVLNSIDASVFGTTISLIETTFKFDFPTNVKELEDKLGNRSHP